MRPPGPGTFWGTHVQTSPFPAGLSVVVLTLAGLGLVHALALDHFAVPGSLRGFLLVALPWAAGLAALLISVFAWASWMTRGGAAALLLCALLPAAGLLALRGTLSTWQAITDLVPDGGQGMGAAWFGGRLTLAAGLQLAWAGPWLERTADGSRERRLGAAVVFLALALAAAFGLASLPEPPLGAGSGDAAILVLLLVAMIPVARLHRRDPGLMTHAMLVSLVPQCAAQLAALA
ncbi:MAG: hypothetical protein ACJ759_03585, partial [Thermoanaerobaculia bacterium]